MTLQLFLLLLLSVTLIATCFTDYHTRSDPWYWQFFFIFQLLVHYLHISNGRGGWSGRRCFSISDIVWCCKIVHLFSQPHSWSANDMPMSAKSKKVIEVWSVSQSYELRENILEKWNPNQRTLEKGRTVSKKSNISRLFVYHYHWLHMFYSFFIDPNLPERERFIDSPCVTLSLG